MKRNKENKMLTTEYNCSLDGVAREFAQIQKEHRSSGNNSIHLIQSWSPEESKRLTREQVHAIGMALAERFAPGHQYIVQTHDDQPHLHNHIMLNPVNMDTGKRIQNKMKNLHTLRALNDDIAKEHGLSVLAPKEKNARSGPSDKAKRIESYRGRSFILDLHRKAQFARAHATNYDEYLAVLNAFDIKARIEPDNIVYFYPGRTHGKRGRSLDPDLDKPGLEARFSRNLERAKSDSNFRDAFQTALTRSPDRAIKMSQEAQQSPLNSQRRTEEFSSPRISALDEGLIPIQALNSAKTKSLHEYCAKNKIRFDIAEDGRAFLQGKTNIEITTHGWINHKNQTRGNIIDFVSNHRQISLLGAVSHLTDNPNLMLLEQYSGKEPSRYKPFAITDGPQASRSDAVKAIQSLLGKQEPRQDFSDLFKSQRLHVGKDLMIRFFSDSERTEFTEYVPTSRGNYKQKRTGTKAAFVNRVKGARELEIFSSPRAYLHHFDSESSRKHASQRPHLVLLEPSLEPIHRAIASEPNLNRVHLIGAPGEDEAGEFNSFFERLRDSLNPFSIDTRLAWTPLPGFNAGRDYKPALDLSLGRDISINPRR